MITGVAVLSVPHSGTHSTFNALTALNYPRVGQEERARAVLGNSLHAHFHPLNGEKLAKYLEYEHIVVPIRSPIMSFLSKYKRLLSKGRPEAKAEALEYTVANWAVLEQKMDKLDDALFVSMEGGDIPTGRIAQYIGQPYKGDVVPVGNIFTKDGNYTKLEDLYVIDGWEDVKQELSQFDDLWNEVLRRSQQ